MQTEKLEEFSEIVRRSVAGTGIELVDIMNANDGTVTVFIDKPGGVNIEECADLSREIDVLADVEGLSGFCRRLEVSSPGPERPLKTVSHYRRFNGRRARVKTKHPLEGRRVFTGNIKGVEGGVLELCADSEGGFFSIPLELIEKANLKPE